MSAQTDYGQPLFTCAAMQRIDKAAQTAFRIPGVVLMEQAGQGAWTILRPRVAGDPLLVFIAGPGNNGGDALVMARCAYTDGFHSVRVVIVREPRAESTAAAQLQIVRALGITVARWDTEADTCLEWFAHADWIVDGVSGTGIEGALREPNAAVVAAVNRSGRRVAAIDMPSGLGDRWCAGMPIVNATLTISTGPLKRCLFDPDARTAVGEVLQTVVGFPPQAVANEPADARLVRCNAVVPLRRFGADAYKGTRGRVVVVGGSSGAGGAAGLAAPGGVHGGAGMVRLLSASEKACAAALTIEPSLMTGFYHGNQLATALEDACAWADTLIVGPGWVDATSDQLQAVIEAVRRHKCSAVLDAAALRLLAQLSPPALRDDQSWRERIVLTPHAGELRALADQHRHESGPLPAWDRALGVSERWGCRIIAKGSVTLVIAEGTAAVYDGRNAFFGHGR